MNTLDRRTIARIERALQDVRQAVGVSGQANLLDPNDSEDVELTISMFLEALDGLGEVENLLLDLLDEAVLRPVTARAEQEGTR